MELQIENGKPAEGSDADSETEGQWLAQMAVVFKDRPKALAAAVRKQFGSTNKATDSQPQPALSRSKLIEPCYPLHT